MNDSIEQWIEALTQGMQELANSTLGYEDFTCLQWAPGNSIPANFCGSYMALLAETVSVQIGIAASNEHCQILAKRMLGMEPDEELPESDTADAIGEMVNIIAGTVKSVMAGYGYKLRLGLPMYVHGRVDVPKQVESAHVEVKMDAMPINLIAYVNRIKADDAGADQTTRSRAA